MEVINSGTFINIINKRHYRNLKLLLKEKDVKNMELMIYTAQKYVLKLTDKKYQANILKLLVKDYGHQDYGKYHSKLLAKAPLDMIGMLINLGVKVNNSNGNCDLLLKMVNKFILKNNLLKLLFQAGGNINTRNDYGEPVFFTIMRYNRRWLIMLFIKAGVDVNLQNNQGETVLSQAISSGRGYHIKILLKAGADVNLTNHLGETLLFNSAKLHDIYCFEILLKSGADVNIQNNNGETILLCSLKNRNPYFVEKLLKAGADVNICNNNNETGLDVLLSTFDRYGYIQQNNECLKLLADKNVRKISLTKSMNLISCIIRNTCNYNNNIFINKNRSKNSHIPDYINYIPHIADLIDNIRSLTENCSLITDDWIFSEAIKFYNQPIIYFYSTNRILTPSIITEEILLMVIPISINYDNNAKVCSRASTNIINLYANKHIHNNNLQMCIKNLPSIVASLKFRDNNMGCKAAIANCVLKSQYMNDHLAFYQFYKQEEPKLFDYLCINAFDKLNYLFDFLG